MGTVFWIRYTVVALLLASKSNALPSRTNHATYIYIYIQIQHTDTRDGSERGGTHAETSYPKVVQLLLRKVSPPPFLPPSYPQDQASQLGLSGLVYWAHDSQAGALTSAMWTPISMVPSGSRVACSASSRSLAVNGSMLMMRWFRKSRLPTERVGKGGETGAANAHGSKRHGKDGWMDG